MFPFLIGLLAGLVASLFQFLLNRRELKRIEERRLHVEQEKEIALNFMHNMAHAMAREPSRKDLLGRINHAVVNGTGALCSCIFEVVDDKKLKGVAVEGLFPPQRPMSEKTIDHARTRSQLLEQILRSEEIDMGEGIIGAVAQTREGVLIPSAEKDPRIVQHKDPSLIVRSMIVAPLLFDNELLGVLAVANPDDDRSFDRMDQNLVVSMAEQAALALNNLDNLNDRIEKQKLDLDLTLAHDVQRLLLPTQFPKTESLEIHALYTPAQKVSGDFYDVIPLEEGCTGVAIADVSGKGVPASLLMAICHTSLRHYAQAHESPSAVLRAMNAEMSAEMRKDMFITLIYAVINEKKSTITLARAGHELPLVLQKGPSGDYLTTAIDSEGMALGMVPCEIFDEVIEDKTIPFGQGETLLLYTDGVTETTNFDDEEYSARRLQNLFKSLREESPERINQEIFESLEQFKGDNHLQDDITLVSVRHKATVSNNEQT
ncbi:MAG: SpoIIE family protein phosphatase [Opitutae bacterium]|nr:SpoIIE family protein phosphatase [Opitutae bacterium]